MDTIVAECIKASPEKLKEWQAKGAATKTNGPVVYNCPNAENVVLVKCLRRNLVLSCPYWKETDECKQLMTFAKSCPAFPFSRLLTEDKGKADKSENKPEKTDEPE